MIFGKNLEIFIAMVITYIKLKKIHNSLPKILCINSNNDNNGKNSGLFPNFEENYEKCFPMTLKNSSSVRLRIIRN